MNNALRHIICWQYHCDGSKLFFFSDVSPLCSNISVAWGTLKLHFTQMYSSIKSYLCSKNLTCNSYHDKDQTLVGQERPWQGWQEGKNGPHDADPQGDDPLGHNPWDHFPGTFHLKLHLSERCKNRFNNRIFQQYSIIYSLISCNPYEVVRNLDNQISHLLLLHSDDIIIL